MLGLPAQILSSSLLCERWPTYTLLRGAVCFSAGVLGRLFRSVTAPLRGSWLLRVAEASAGPAGLSEALLRLSLGYFRQAEAA